MKKRKKKLNTRKVNKNRNIPNKNHNITIHTSNVVFWGLITGKIKYMLR